MEYFTKFKLSLCSTITREIIYSNKIGWNTIQCSFLSEEICYTILLLELFLMLTGNNIQIVKHIRFKTILEIV